MESENNNQESMYCEDDGDYRVNCEICDKIGIEQLYENHS